MRWWWSHDETVLHSSLVDAVGLEQSAGASAGLGVVVLGNSGLSLGGDVADDTSVMQFNDALDRTCKRSHQKKLMARITP